MANRDYYGDNVPVQLTGEHQHQQSTLQGHSDAGSTQDTQQWTNNPNYEESVGDKRLQRNDYAQPDHFNGAAEGERGLGAMVVGGVGGAFVGHQVGKKSHHGTLGAVGGALAGAVMANVASNMVKGHHHRHGDSARDRRRERLEQKLDRLR